jgi:ABC-2 type transport system permease protein
MMIGRFFEQAYLYHKGRSAAFNTEEFVLMQIGYPLITLIFYCLIASYSFRTTDLTRWVIGNAFLLCTNACVFDMGRIFVAERYTGRLRSIIAAPGSKIAVILASGVFPMLFAVCASVSGLVVGTVIFGVSFKGISLLRTAVAILVAMTSASAFGLFVSSFGLVSDSMHLILNIVSYIFMIFTGAEFPVSQLPFFGQVIAQLMPLTKALYAMNMLFEGDTKYFWPCILAEMATAVVYALLAVTVFYFAEKAAERNGRFDMF